jgi:hypothetical protein
MERKRDETEKEIRGIEGAEKRREGKEIRGTGGVEKRGDGEGNKRDRRSGNERRRRRK